MLVLTIAAMGRFPYYSMGGGVPISVSSRHFALRYEVPKFLPRGGHLCMAVRTIAALTLLQARCIVVTCPSIELVLQL